MITRQRASLAAYFRSLCRRLRTLSACGLLCLLPALTVSLGGLSCDRKGREPTAGAPAPASVAGKAGDAVQSGTGAAAGPPPYIETGDLDAMRRHGIFRLVVPRPPVFDHLPRGVDDPYASEWDLVERLSEDLDLDLKVSVLADREDRIRALLKGEADMGSDFLSSDAAADPRVRYTMPVRTVKGLVIVRADRSGVAKPRDLSNLKSAIQKGSEFLEVARRLKGSASGMTLIETPDSLTPDALAQGVVDGEYDAAVVDSAWFETIEGFRGDLRVAFELGVTSSLCGIVRPDADALWKALGGYMQTELRHANLAACYSEDLPGIKSRGVLRVLTRNNSVCYYLSHGELAGFEYELVRKFARDQGLRLRMIVPPAFGDLIRWLKEGKGDIIAAGMTILESRRKEGVAFSIPYNHIRETLVGRVAEPGMASLDALAGRTVVVQKGTSYWETLQSILDKGIRFKLVAAPKEMDFEEIIAKVADGSYDLTVVDNNILDAELTWRTDVKALLEITPDESLGWAVRPSDPALLDAVNGFIKKEYGSPFYQTLVQTYFKYRPPPRAVGKAGFTDGTLSPFDDLARAFAEKYRFDWRLISAQMYTESRFNPKARSRFGAIGLLQVLPSTARSVGIMGNLAAPEHGLHAGVRYLDSIRKGMDSDLQVSDLIAFCLASYNAGPARIRDARQITKSRGLDPDRWDGNVEDTLRLLSSEKGAKLSKFGYCRCMEPIQYVHNISDLFEVYLRGTKE